VLSWYGGPGRRAGPVRVCDLVRVPDVDEGQVRVIEAKMVLGHLCDHRVGLGELPWVVSAVHPVDGADPGAEERAGPELCPEDQCRGRAVGAELRASAECRREQL